jgi:sugar lactone lactonase YvrE
VKKCRRLRFLRAIFSRFPPKAIFTSWKFAFLVAGLNLLIADAEAQSIYSQAYTFTTFAGQSVSRSADGAGDDAGFYLPAGVAVDTAGNVYVADTGNNTIRKITPAGGVTTIAGFAGRSGSADGTNSDARFNGPGGVAVDAIGNIYVADNNNDTIRKVTPTGTSWVVTTMAGLPGVFGTNDGTGSAARFYDPSGVAVDTNGNIFVADRGNNLIRKITAVGTNWVVTTPVGLAGIYVTNHTKGAGYVAPSRTYVVLDNAGANDGVGTNAQFNAPSGITVDHAGSVYVADEGNGTIRKITPNGTNWAVTTLAGVAGNFTELCDVAVDSAGNLYAADYFNCTISKVTSSGTNWIVTTLAGDCSTNQEPIIGYADGTGTNAQFDLPFGVAVDTNGNVYVADTDNNTIRKITSAGVVSTMAGLAAANKGSANGTGYEAQFNSPCGTAVDGAGNVYVADSANATIRKITPLAVVSTIAGLVGSPGSSNGAGTDAQFDSPFGVAVDSTGNVYVADAGNNTIREITPAGVVTTLAGLYQTNQYGNIEGGYADGRGTNAQFYDPFGVAVDSAGNVYVADTDNFTIRKITPLAEVTTLAGSAGTPGSTDGVGTNALFGRRRGLRTPGGGPEGLAVDGAGNIYVADTGNDTIRKVTPIGTNWVVSTIAGLVSNPGDADGLGTNAQFYAPAGMAVDSAGNIYVADTGNDALRKITKVGTNWMVTTIAGVAGQIGSADGAGSAALFDQPFGFAVDGAGNVYVADTGNNTIREGVFQAFSPAMPVSFTQPANNATLVVTLLPSEADGQWRFPWELAWRQSGTAATNLVPNQNYTVEFSPVSGYLAIPAEETVFVGDGQTNITGQYYPTVTSVDSTNGGSLEVIFQVNAPSGAGWRLLGDPNTNWLSSGFVTNLLPGNYLIECAALSNFTQIPIQSLQIAAGLPTVVQEIYQPSQPLPTGSAFLLPEPVPSGEISDSTNYPYGFSGQLETDVGYGGGVAVLANVVLTAAHLVFNDQTLSYVSNAWWFPQEEAPQYVPQPLAAQGWLVLSGYASQRTNDLQSGFYPDQSSPQSRNFDVAALYFQSPVAGGGYGGYLPSDATPNAWLTSTANKMLVGYPVDASMFQGQSVQPGQMYEVGPQPYPLSVATDPGVNDEQVYTASWFLSYPGNSGGPFYAQLNGYYYPAGVYLGTLFSGTVPYASAVRAIDSNVVNLITNAQAIVATGTNNSGGGVVTINAGSGIASNPGAVEVTISPPAVVQAGGAWKLSTLSDSWYSTQNPSALAVNSTNEEQLQFKQITGWNLPANQSVTVAPGAVTCLTNSYTLAVSWPTPAAITYGTALSSKQLDATNVIGVRGNYAYSPTNGSVLNVGTNTLSVIFTPNNTNEYGGASVTSVSLVVLPPPPDIQTVRRSGSSFTFTWSAMANQSYQIQTKTNLTQPHWTTLSNVLTATNSSMTTSASLGASSQQFYRVVLLP